MKMSLQREHIAQVAARLIAEDGSQSYRVAKRKAARQLGISETRHLPTNEEIDVALRAHHALYCADSQPQALLSLRQRAYALMQLFEPFHPYLTGSVLKGTANTGSTVDIELYTDDAKMFEMFLLNRRWNFRLGDRRAANGGARVPVFELDFEDISASVTLYSERDHRNLPKNEGERATLARLKDLLDMTRASSA